VKSVIVVSLLLGLTSYAGTVAGTQIHDATPPTEGYIAPTGDAKDGSPSKSDDYYQAVLDKDSCDDAYRKAISSGVSGDSALVAELSKATEACKMAVNNSCDENTRKSSADRIAAAVCRLKAAHAAYLKVAK